MIYFIQSGTDGPIKIGFASNNVERSDLRPDLFDVHKRIKKAGAA